MKKIIIITDYKDFFGVAVRKYKDESMDVASIKSHLVSMGYEVCVSNFSSLNFREPGYQNCAILYQSSEDDYLLYQSFIEDCLLGLKLLGATLVPRFEYFRAHHNKVFMEILRDVVGTDEMKSISSHYFGALPEFKRALCQIPETCILKSASGCSATGVVKARTRSESSKYAQKLMKSPNRLSRLLREHLKHLLLPKYVPSSAHRSKIIVQSFVPHCSYDYKVLVYGKKYYVLRRENRNNDFRASGSGLLSWPSDIPDGLLEFSRGVFARFEVPFIALDIGYTDPDFHLFEFQFLHFGPTALQRAPFCFQRDHGKWNKIPGPFSVEFEYANAVDEYLRSTSV